MSALPWVLFAGTAAVLVIVTAAILPGAIGRLIGTPDVPSEPDPAQVEALKAVFVDVSKASGHGAALGEFARAALVWMQQGGAR